MRQHPDQVSSGDTAAADPSKTCVHKFTQIARLPLQAAECHDTGPIVLRSRSFDGPGVQSSDHAQRLSVGDTKVC